MLMPFDLTRGAPQRIAIIGGGIAGLSAAWLLRNHHDVTVYEAQPRLGGHARTVMVGDQPVDTGFIVFNFANYPHLTAMFRDLDVPIQRSDMSFGVSLNGGALEYALRSGNALYGQRRNMISPGFHRMVRDILHFNAKAEAAAVSHPDLTIDDLLRRLGVGARFRDHYLFPICGAIWSTPACGIGAFPAETLIRFMRNHALMSPGGQHQWWTVAGGSGVYVDKLIVALAQAGVKLRPGTGIRAATRAESGVTLHGDGFASDAYDQVVFATHADVTLKMLANPTTEEQLALSAVRFQPNRAVLHSDPAVMPIRRRCWSSWVYRADTAATDGPAIGVTYWMNRLQNIPDATPLFVSLNPEIAIRDDLIHDQTTFHHPVFDHAAIKAQTRIAAIQGQNRSWFAGAWLRNGFHEDGFASSVRIARHLLPARV